MKQKLLRLLCLVTALICLCTGAFAYTKLYEGVSGSEVKAMQIALNMLGYNLKEDGKFGSGTERAVKDFQKKHNLTVDGIAGNNTLSLLYSLTGGNAGSGSGSASPTQAPTKAPTTAPTKAPSTGTSQTYQKLQRGDKNSRVADMQRALTKLGYPLTADGNFGSGTYAAVRAFQQKYNLKVDGIAGNQTLTLLFSLANGGTAATQQPAVPTVQPTIAPTRQPSSPSIGVAIVTTTGGTLNFRDEPDGDILKRIPNTSVLQLLSRGSTWCKVSYQGEEGYVMTKFLTIMASSGSTQPSATAAPTQKPATSSPTVGQAKVTTTGGSLNLRDQASDIGSILVRIPNGTILNLLSKGNTWCKVIYQGEEGYVMTKFLTFLTGSATPAPTKAPTATQNPPASEGGSGATEEEENDPSVYSRTLRSGMYGEDVRWVQNRLKELKYTVNVTATYDSTTIAAVKFFQSQNGLDADGLAGKQTFAALKNDNARTANDEPLSYITLSVAIEKKYLEQTKKLQTRLQALGFSVNINGDYDVKTHDAIVGFQRRNGLVISGIADALTQQTLYSSSAKGASVPVSDLEADAGKVNGPSQSQVKLLHWYDEVKPSIKSGQTVVIFDPATSLSWNIKLYSLGRHADSQPASFRDTQIMNRSFGPGSWTCHPVYVQLPDGRWTLASMHNRPHLYGSIIDNGFGGHLCIHFLRDMDECILNDPNYGVTNQKTIRSAWKAMTGETVE